MRKINIFGKKIPILAILAVLIIGIGSAAVFTHYATLTGQIVVVQPISVTDSYGDELLVNGLGSLNFNSPAPFTINNNGNVPVLVDLSAILYLDDVEVENFEGINGNYLIGNEVYGIEDSLTVIVPPGGLNVEVDLTMDTYVLPGTYTIDVSVDVNTGDYSDEMINIVLTHKDELSATEFNPIGEDSYMSYAAMGNEFYYELDLFGLTTGETYSLIYYSDPWPGNNPGAVIGEPFTVTNEDGTITLTGHSELDMNIPVIPDANIVEGGKVWVILTSDLTDGAMPMDSWNSAEYLFEHSEILDLVYDDLVRYIDTGLTTFPVG